MHKFLQEKKKVTVPQYNIKGEKGIWKKIDESEGRYTMKTMDSECYCTCEKKHAKRVETRRIK